MALPRLPDELLHTVLSHLDIPDLLSVSRTSHHLRRLALDPHLHRRRLSLAPAHIGTFLPRRPALASLIPPQSGIYLSPTALAARRLGWAMVRIRLGRCLARRPGVGSLVAWGILPRECLGGGGGLVAMRKRRVEREMVKTGLRVWLEKKARDIKGRKDGVVGVLVWRFSRWREKGREKVGIVVEGPEGGVQGLRRYWEGMAKG